MKKLKTKIINFFKWIYKECKDWHTLALFIFIVILLYSPTWLCYILYAITKWKWCMAVASAYMLFWAGPFTPFFPLCLSITLSIKKLLELKNNKK